MAPTATRSGIVSNSAGGSGPQAVHSSLRSVEGCTAVLNELLETAPNDVGATDVAVLNLLCAPTLPGSADLNIPDCLARLDRLAAVVKAATERNLYRFPTDPDYGHCEPMWRMALLVTVVKRTFGAAYNPEVIADTKAGVNTPMVDSRDSFIHGLLNEDRSRRYGTCASIPVLVVSVARHLGYPVHLAVAGRHLFARWDGDGTRFNVEASNPMGMTVQSDDEYRKLIPWAGSTPAEENSPYYLRNLSPAEEFALFLTFRVECLLHAARYGETLLWSARALQFAPDDPGFPRLANYVTDLALKNRLRRARPDVRIPPMDAPEPFFFDAGELLRIEERSLYMTVIAHDKERSGDLDAARAAYEEACRQNFHGNQEQRDLQRFLKQHGLPRRVGPLLPPKNLGRPRRFKLSCQPHEEAHTLLQLAHWFESRGELVKARDALHDLYLLDPAHSGVFLRARAIERHPQFQQKLTASVINCSSVSLHSDPSNPPIQSGFVSRSRKYVLQSNDRSISGRGSRGVY